MPKPTPNTTDSPYATLPFVTIDSESTKDIDDALFVERLDTGYRLVVAIANPTGLVKIGSTEDEQARLMAATAYIRDRAVRRMLPPVISEARGSLVAGQARPAMVFDISLTETLEVSKTNISLATITVASRLSHPDIPAIVSDTTNPTQAMLALAATLGRLLLDARQLHGALALYDLSRLLVTDEEGRLQAFHSVEDVIGYIVVQEVMILVNHEAAKWMIERDLPAIFRNHAPRSAAPRADALAATIDQWLHGNNFDIDDVRLQFAAVAGRANYGASALGHYGLSLPSYLHVSSPLRRYADLVNMRQMAASLLGRPLPYDKPTLETLSADLNDALERRKEERSESFKDAVRKHAESAVSAGQLTKLADHELRQAIKLAQAAGYLPESLSSEIARRYDKAIATDLLSNCLLDDIPAPLLTDEIRRALGEWLADAPSRAMQMIHHGQQSGTLLAAAFSTAAVDGAFCSTCDVTDRGGQRYSVTGNGSRKRDAEQAAALLVLSALLNLPHAVRPSSSAPAAQPVAIAGANPKSALLELCTQAGWPTPVFTASGKGPSHQMVFTASATLEVAGVPYAGHAPQAPTKKAAEAIAADALLQQLQVLVERRTAPAAPPSSANPVGKLQEIAQKGRLTLPVYDVRQAQETPPLFVCTVTVAAPVSGRFSGEASTKQGAKAQAATAALGVHAG